MDDSDLLFLTAQSHQQLNDPFTASAILLSAVEANPENAQLLDAYFIALKAAEMDTDAILASRRAIQDQTKKSGYAFHSVRG